MSVSVRWLDDAAKNAVILEFEGEWEWNDFHATIQTSHQMIESVDYGVDLIVHHKANKAERTPMAHFQKAIKHQPDNLRQVILVNPNAHPNFIKFLQALAKVFEKMRLAGTPTKFVSSLEEARLLVEQRQDATV